MSLLGVQYVRGAMRSTVAPTAFAKPKAVAMDYRSSASEFGGTAFDATALALHLKYPISVLNMTATQAAVGAVGYQFVQSLMAADAAHVVGQYTIATQQYDSVSGGSTFQSIWSELDANNWWAKSATTGLKTKTGNAVNYNSYEVNLCPAYTTANGGGDKAAEVIAQGYTSIIIGNLYTAGVRLIFQDNVWGNPGGFTTGHTIDSAGNDLGAGKIADYDLNGTNDTLTNSSWALRDSAPNVEWRKGLANYVTEMKALNSGLKVMGNADADLLVDATYGNSCLGTTELLDVYEYGFIEGLTAAAGSTNTSNMRTCIDAFRGRFADTINRYYTQHDGSSVAAIVGAYVKSLTETQSRTLQKCRYALGVTLLGDGYCAVSDRGLGSANMKPYWFDELDQLIGDPTESRPTTAATGYDGMWKRAYSNGLSIVNPSSNKGRWMQNATGGITIQRSGGVVTLTWGSNGISSLRTWVNGVTKVRLVDSTQVGGSPTFDGTFTITSNTATTLTWADARADTSLVSNPDGFLETQSTVDLTGQGYKHFLGTQDAHNDYDNGTSQNDGLNVTTVRLWSGDAVLLLKQ